MAGVDKDKIKKEVQEEEEAKKIAANKEKEASAESRPSLTKRKSSIKNLFGLLSFGSSNNETNKEEVEANNELLPSDSTPSIQSPSEVVVDESTPDLKDLDPGIRYFSSIQLVVF